MTDQDFKDTVLVSLAQIKLCLDQNEKDHAKMVPLVEKIPLMEIGLNNHLASHNNIKKYVYYPILVAAFLGLGTLFFKIVLKVF